MNRGKFQGVFAIQMPLDRISAITERRNGLGETGEAYLLGADGLFRTNARYQENAVLSLKGNEKLRG